MKRQNTSNLPGEQVEAIVFKMQIQYQRVITVITSVGRLTF